MEDRSPSRRRTSKGPLIICVLGRRQIPVHVPDVFDEYVASFPAQPFAHRGILHRQVHLPYELFTAIQLSCIRPASQPFSFLMLTYGPIVGVN